MRRIALILALLAVPVVAVAAYVFTLGVSGSIQVGTGEVHYVTSVPPEGCDASYVSDTELALNWTPLPGDTCTLLVVVGANGNTEDMRLQGFTAPSGIDAVLGADCGKLVAAGRLQHLRHRPGP